MWRELWRAPWPALIRFCPGAKFTNMVYLFEQTVKAPPYSSNFPPISGFRKKWVQAFETKKQTSKWNFSTPDDL